jgi:hypothetical protein
LHADNAAIFHQVGQCGSQHGLQELSQFSSRPEEAKSPRSMGLEAYQEGGHVHFRPRRHKETKSPVK